MNKEDIAAIVTVIAGVIITFLVILMVIPSGSYSKHDILIFIASIVIFLVTFLVVVPIGLTLGEVIIERVGKSIRMRTIKKRRAERESARRKASTEDVNDR